MTKRELKQEIDQLRNDMAAEFVKRDKDIIESRTEGIKTRNAFDNTLAKLAKRVDWLEEVVGFLNCFQYGLMQACGVTDSQREIAGRIAKERYDALKKGDWDILIVQTKEKYEALKVTKQEALKPEADLFSEPAEEDVWIDSKEACSALGWKSISTTMLRKAGIRYQQPLGKHRKITAHKGDIENYVRNRRDGRK